MKILEDSKEIPDGTNNTDGNEQDKPKQTKYKGCAVARRRSGDDPKLKILKVRHKRSAIFRPNSIEKESKRNITDTSQKSMSNAKLTAQKTDVVDHAKSAQKTGELSKPKLLAQKAIELSYPYPYPKKTGAPSIGIPLKKTGALKAKSPAKKTGDLRKPKFTAKKIGAHKAKPPKRIGKQSYVKMTTKMRGLTIPMNQKKNELGKTKNVRKDKRRRKSRRSGRNGRRSGAGSSSGRKHKPNFARALKHKNKDTDNRDTVRNNTLNRRKHVSSRKANKHTYLRTRNVISEGEGQQDNLLQIDITTNDITKLSMLKSPITMNISEFEKYKKSFIMNMTEYDSSKIPTNLNVSEFETLSKISFDVAVYIIEKLLNSSIAGNSTDIDDYKHAFDVLITNMTLFNKMKHRRFFGAAWNFFSNVAGAVLGAVVDTVNAVKDFITGSKSDYYHKKDTRYNKGHNGPPLVIIINNTNNNSGGGGGGDGASLRLLKSTQKNNATNWTWKLLAWNKELKRLLSGNQKLSNKNSSSVKPLKKCPLS